MSQDFMDERRLKLSKALSFLLRHGAQEQGLPIGADGFASISNVLIAPCISIFKPAPTIEEIQTLVRLDNKQRYSIKRGDAGIFIRANQGHSRVQVESEALLTPVELGSITYACHGTYTKHMTSILQTGLSRMSRKHIHFTADDAQSQETLMRKTCDIIIYVDVHAAIQGGFKFFTSDNQVILTEGDSNGMLPATFFSRIVIVKRKGGQCIDLDMTDPMASFLAMFPKYAHPAFSSSSLSAASSSSSSSLYHAPDSAALASSASAANAFDYIAVLDFEATCVENKDVAFQSEIIELPVIVFDYHTLEDVLTFHTYVKPTLHPQLSEFCTKLTGIQQDTVNQGMLASEAFDRLHATLESSGLLKARMAFLTCGDWDLLRMLPSQFALLQRSIPSYFQRWINIKKVFSKHIAVTTGMADMLNILGLQLEGHHHSGIDDVKNIVRIAKNMIKRGIHFDSFTGGKSYNK